MPLYGLRTEDEGDKTVRPRVVGNFRVNQDPRYRKGEKREICKGVGEGVAVSGGSDK